MPDLRTRFQPADRIAAPDLWPDVLTREPGEPPPRSPWGRVTALAIAVGVAALAILVLIRVLPLGSAKPVAPSPTPSSTITPGPTPSPAKLPSAGEVVGTIHFDATILAAADGKLFAIRQDTEKAYTMARIERDGSMTTVRIRDNRSRYIGRIAATSEAVYLGTEVIHRFTNDKDELIRIDANTLKPTAKITLDDNVLGIVASPDSVWVALSDRVLRLDPVTLATRSTFMVPGIAPAPIGPGSVGSLALGWGGLWVVAGNAARSTLYRLDPNSLSALGRASVPGLPDQGFIVSADDQAVWMVYSSGVRKVDPQSGAIRRLIPIQEVTTADARGTGLVAMLGQSSIAQIDSDGRVVALTENLGDIGGSMAVDGQDVWISAGATSILHFVLADVPAGS
ncbi:MAG: hypothetical protein E6G40_01760 [Actinobacteria bacterium]|nr:MAG: hypothetical protein E6G40_01760 [Actinomycetota bacterium]